MDENFDDQGIWTANLNPNEPLELTYARVDNPVGPSVSGSLPNLSCVFDLDLEQVLAANRPSTSRSYDLMRPRSDTPRPFRDISTEARE